MNKIAILGLTVAVSASMTFASVTFYLEDTSPLTGNEDQGWQTALGDNFTEFNMDNFANYQNVDKLVSGSLEVDLGLSGLGGEATTAEVFWGSYGPASSAPGSVSGGALLNRDAGDGIHSEITFTFNTPVLGFGAWIFDNNASSPESFKLIITEVGDGETASNLLESGNGTDHALEGWLAATSGVGITKATIQVVDELTGDPVARYFEVDHVQVGAPVPVPGAVLLGAMGLGMVGWLKRRKKEA